MEREMEGLRVEAEEGREREEREREERGNAVRGLKEVKEVLMSKERELALVNLGP
jgi:hypothetical protein